MKITIRLIEHSLIQVLNRGHVPSPATSLMAASSTPMPSHVDTQQTINGPSPDLQNFNARIWKGPTTYLELIEATSTQENITEL
jgi:hypothetical protein